ncbi:MAG TPA: zf-HC2 domain-containing protein [Thermoleophilaceae bacterium]
MEQATLRPVPLRPVGPVDPSEALAHVLDALPDLREDAARALSLIEIAGRTRDKAVEEMEISGDTLASLLYDARKALRRSVFPLSASGWCERAERLLSDQIDGVLTPPGPARLGVHLRNCERCVDHERKLSQAREKLVREFIDAHPHTAGAGPAERPAATLRVVEPVVAEPLWDGPTHTVASFAGVAIRRGETELPILSFAGPGGQVEIRVEAPELPEDPPLDDDIPPSEPADTTPSEEDAERPDPPVEDAGISLVWGTLTAVSVGLAILALVVTVLALSGLDRVF